MQRKLASSPSICATEGLTLHGAPLPGLAAGPSLDLDWLLELGHRVSQLIRCQLLQGGTACLFSFL